jgi:hypothetical protein
MLDLLGESHALIEFSVVLELEVGDASDHLEEFDELEHAVLSHVLLFEHHTHLAHAVAERGLLLTDAQLRVPDHQIHGVGLSHELLSWLLIIVVDFLQAFEVGLKDIVYFNCP